MNSLFLGIFPPEIAGILLPIVIFGIIGFLLCYFHRFFVFIVLPTFLGCCIYLIDYLKFFTDLFSNYMLTVYLTMILSAIAVIIGTRLSWKKHNGKFSKLK